MALGTGNEKIIIETKIDQTGLKSGLNESKGLLNGFSSGIGSTFAKLGTIAGVAVAIKAVGAAIKATVYESAKLETSIAKASTLFGNANVNTEKLGANLRNIASETGIAAEALGDSLYNALSAGVPATDDMSEALGLLEQSAKLAKAGFTDIDTALTATAKTINAYKMNISDADKIMKVLLQTQNLGITTVGELGDKLAQVTPTASAFGLAFEEVGASLALMTAQGTPTAQATTQLNALLNELGKQGMQGADNLKEAAEAAGLTTTSFQGLLSEGYSLSDILKLVKEHADKNNKSMIDMFGSIEAGKSALAISSDLEKYNHNLEAMATTQDLLGESYTKVTETYEGASERLKTAFAGLSSAIGDWFRPAATVIKGGLADLISGMTDNRSAADKLTEATENLKKANESYLGVVKEVGTEESLVAEQRITEAKRLSNEAIQALIKAYQDAQYENEHGQGALVANIGSYLPTSFTELESEIKAWAEHYKIAFTDVESTYSELLKLFNNEQMYGWGWNKGAFEVLIDDFNTYKENVKAVDDYAATFEKVQTDAITAIANAYVNGDKSVMAYIGADAALTKLVETKITAIEGEREAQEKANKASETALKNAQNYIKNQQTYNIETERGAKGLEEYAKKKKEATTTAEDLAIWTNVETIANKAYTEIVDKAAKAEEDRQAKIQDATDTMNTAVKAAEDMKKALGNNADESDYLTAKTTAYQDAITALLAAGLSPQDKAVKKIVEDYIASKNALDALGDTTQTSADVMKDYAQKVEVANEKQKQGISTEKEAAQEFANIASAAMTTLMAMEGFDAADKDFQSLLASFKEWIAVANAADPSTTIEDMDKEIALHAGMVEAGLIKPWEAAALNAETLTAGIKQLIKEGIDPESAEIKKLTGRLKEYNAEADVTKDMTQQVKEVMDAAKDSSKDWWKEFAEESASWTDFVVDSCKTMFGTIESGFEELGTWIFTKNKQLAELGNQITTLGNEITDWEEMLSDAQAELAQQQADGDAEAIANAQALVDSYQEKIDAIKEEKRALEDEQETVKKGGDVWKGFGKIALEALSNVLEGLGAELAARAVVALLPPSNWGAFATATAGSVAAYAAAGLIKGWANSFAEGGIVQAQNGRATTGDNTIVYANPGELILNRAQQSAIAQQLQLLDRLQSNQANAPTGQTIIVQFTGTVLGDQKTISEWVYDGIQQCRNQGRI